MQLIWWNKALRHRLICYLCSNTWNDDWNVPSNFEIFSVAKIVFTDKMVIANDLLAFKTVILDEKTPYHMIRANWSWGTDLLKLSEHHLCIFLSKICEKWPKIHINGVLTTVLLYMQISLSLIWMPLSKTFHLSY